MSVIPVSSYPWRAYGSFEEAAAAGERDEPLQTRARADTLALQGSALAGHCWQASSCQLQFTGGQSLVVRVANHEVDWLVCSQISLPRSERWSPSTIAWSDDHQAEFDPDTILRQLHGAAFHRLCYLDSIGLALYTRGHEILRFGVLFREDKREDMLYADWFC